MIGTTDIPQFASTSSAGCRGSGPRNRQRSPLTYAPDIKTPVSDTPGGACGARSGSPTSCVAALKLLGKEVE